LGFTACWGFPALGWWHNASKGRRTPVTDASHQHKGAKLMEGAHIGSSNLSTHATRDAALEAARARRGDEAIVETGDGQFALREMTFDTGTARRQMLDQSQTGSYSVADVDVHAVSFAVETSRDDDTGCHIVTQEVGLRHFSQEAQQLRQQMATMAPADLSAALRRLTDSAKTDGWMSASESATLHELTAAASDQLMNALNGNLANPDQAILDAMTAVGDMQSEAHAYNRTQPLPGLRVTDGGQFANPAEALRAINQLDDFDETTHDGDRCGAQDLLSAAIMQGPSTVDGAIAQLRARGHQRLDGISAQDGLSQREIALVADAMYTEGRKHVPHGSPQGLRREDLMHVAQDLGISPAATHGTVPRASIGLSSMAAQESRMFLIDTPDADKMGNHWVQVSRVGDTFQAFDPMFSNQTQTFTTAADAEAWVLARAPERDSDNHATTQIETLALPPAAVAVAAQPPAPAAAQPH
jgi:hypothetical protein